LIEVKSLWTNFTPEVVSKFFKSIVKDVRKVVVPEWGPFENEPEIQDYGHSLIEMIMAKGSNRLKGAMYPENMY
jgi:hypothetical protein